MMFCGLMSRWMMSCLCATESACEIWEPICATLRPSRAPCFLIPLLRSVPRRYSMTMKYVSPSLPQSYTETM